MQQQINKPTQRPALGENRDLSDIRARMSRLPPSPVLQKLSDALYDMQRCAGALQKVTLAASSGPGAMPPVIAAVDRAVQRTLSYLLLQAESYCELRENKTRASTKPVDSARLADLIWSEVVSLDEAVSSDAPLGEDLKMLCGRVRERILEQSELLGDLPPVSTRSAKLQRPVDLPPGAYDTELNELILSMSEVGVQDDTSAEMVGCLHQGLRELHAAAVCLEQAKEIADTAIVGMPAVLTSAETLLRLSLSLYIFNAEDVLARKKNGSGKSKNLPLKLMRQKAEVFAAEATKLESVAPDVVSHLKMTADCVKRAADYAEVWSPGPLRP